MHLVFLSPHVLLLLCGECRALAIYLAKAQGSLSVQITHFPLTSTIQPQCLLLVS